MGDLGTLGTLGTHCRSQEGRHLPLPLDIGRRSRTKPPPERCLGLESARASVWFNQFRGRVTLTPDYVTGEGHLEPDRPSPHAGLVRFVFSRLHHYPDSTGPILMGEGFRTPLGSRKGLRTCERVSA